MTYTCHPAAIPEDELLKQCRMELTRGSGPGGQHRNKTETTVRLVHEPTGRVGQAGERREQRRNKQVALFRLRITLALHERGYFALKDVPSTLWQQRCSKGRIAINPNHADFPCILAELLDVLALKRYDPKPAATVLGISSSQLVKLLKLEPQALAMVNEYRSEQKMHTLK